MHLCPGTKNPVFTGTRLNLLHEYYICLIHVATFHFKMFKISYHQDAAGSQFKFSAVSQLNVRHFTDILLFVFGLSDKTFQIL